MNQSCENVKTSIGKQPDNIRKLDSNTNSIEERTILNVGTENETWQSASIVVTRNDSSTETNYINHDENLHNKLRDLFLAIKDEIYDESDEAETFNILLELLNQYGDRFIQSVMSAVISNNFNAVLIGELLAKLGSISPQINTKNSISWLLQCCLFESSNPKIRYGAIVGLSYIKSPKLLNQLNIALRNEENATLKIDIRNLISKIKP